MPFSAFQNKATFLKQDYNETKSWNQVSTLNNYVYRFEIHFLSVFSNVTLKFTVSINVLARKLTHQNIWGKSAREKACM